MSGMRAMSVKRLPLLKTWGPACNNLKTDDDCDHLWVDDASDDDRCKLFDTHLEHRYGVFVRCPECVAKYPDERSEGTAWIEQP